MITYQIYDDTNELLAEIYCNNGKYTSKIIKHPSRLMLFASIEAGKTRVTFEGDPNPSSSALEGFLSDRVLPEGRMYLKEEMERHGLYTYDWRELIKLNKGKTVSDDLYIEVIEDEHL